MRPDDRAPDNPHEWLRRANSSLRKAELGGDSPGIYREDLCFDAQQAAEKAVKALLVERRIVFPYVHDLRLLLSLLEQAGVGVPDEVRRAEELTKYATAARYPDLGEPVTDEEYHQAFAWAEAVVGWAERTLCQ